MRQKWVKHVFFQKGFWTIGGAQTSEMSPFLARFDPVYPIPPHVCTKLYPSHVP